MSRTGLYCGASPGGAARLLNDLSTGVDSLRCVGSSGFADTAEARRNQLLVRLLAIWLA